MVQGFISLNPGLFIAAGALVSETVTYVLGSLILVITFLISRKMISGIWFRNRQSVQGYLDRLQSEYKPYLDKGYFVKVSEGEYRFTSEYLSSNTFKDDTKKWSQFKEMAMKAKNSARGLIRSIGGSSRWGSSRSGSRSRSSSRGGRSGGGGSSSRW